MGEDEFEEHPDDDMSQYQDYPYEFDYQGCLTRSLFCPPIVDAAENKPAPKGAFFYA